jgi:hypothetical protein
VFRPLLVLVQELVLVLVLVLAMPGAFDPNATLALVPEPGRVWPLRKDAACDPLIPNSDQILVRPACVAWDNKTKRGKAWFDTHDVT